MPSYTPAALTNSYSQTGLNTNEMFTAVTDDRMEWVKQRKLTMPMEGMKYWIQETTNKLYVMHSWLESGAIVPQAKGTDFTPTMHLTPGFPNTLKPIEFKLGIKFDKLLIETDQFGVIEKHSEHLGQAVLDTCELYTAMPFNTTFAATVPMLCADGLRLIDTARPQEKASAGTWTNEETASGISMASIALMRTNFEATKSGTGLTRPQRMLKLVIPQALEDATVQATGVGVKWELGASKVPENNTNRLNALTKYGLNYEVWHFLNPASNPALSPWFGMGELNEQTHQLYWVWGHKPDIYPAQSGNERVRAYELYFRFIQGADKPIGIRGNSGS